MAKLLFALLVLAAMGALAFWLVAIKGKPWWIAAVLVTGAAGVLAGFFFIKRYLVRGRERKFVQRVIDQDTEAIKRGPVSQRHELIELQEHWKHSVTRLQQSHLRRLGNPLYVLPWFLIMGESKTGKTSAVKNACQSTPMSEISRSAGISGTRNCDWWFFDQAIILDTAGRYTIPIDEGPDLEEWKQFLVLLGKYRKREPLNGVIVAISADKLVKADEALLREEGQSIRRRIDQMMRIMGAKFPVYLLVTKMDLVHGFCEFNQALSSDYVAQAMGYTNTPLQGYWGDVLAAAVGTICTSLKNLRFLLVHKDERPAPGALLFPTEFERMVPGMTLFLEAVFKENLYQETPLFRGLYFSSALRNQAPQSEFLTATGLQVDAPVDPTPGDGLFLKDFFAGILPKDRNLFSPLREFVLWRRWTRSLGLLSWGLISLAVCGLLGLSYYHNATAIRDFRKTFYDPPVLCREYATDLLMLDRLRLEILEMQQKNHASLLPRFGLNHSIRMVDDLKQHYLKLFKEDFLVPLDDKVMLNIERTARISEDEFVDYAGYVVAQIGVLTAHLAGEPPPQGNEFRLIAANLLTDLDNELLPEIVQKFGDGYFAYLDWNKDKSATEAKLEEFRTALVDLIEKRGRDLRWLVHGWIPETSAIRIEDFLETATTADVNGKLYIPGAFTQEGRQHIETFMAYIEAALGQGDKAASGPPQAVADQAGVPLKRVSYGQGDAKATSASGQAAAVFFGERKKAFWAWYRQAFYQAWYTFIDGFPEAVEKIKDQTTRQRLAFLMPSEQNPYFKLLQRAGDEIAALDKGEEAPDFAGLILRINKVRAFALKEKQTSVTEKIAYKADELKEKIERKTDQEKARALEENLELARAWNDYKDALEKIKIGLSSQEQGYQTYLGGFASGGASKTASAGQTAGASSSLADTDYAYRKLKTMMTGKTDAPVVWDLVRGPQGFLMDLSAAQASCFLQDQWHEQVLSFLQGIDPDKIPRLLFDKQEGLVWKFLDQSAKPFITRSKSGYVPKRDFRGKRLPFRPEFMHLLNQGEKAVLDHQPEYRVGLETVPIDVNDNATAEPFAAILKVNCADKKYALENYNYPNKATFKWNPAQCGDTTLSIVFKRFTLTRTYKGSLGFAEFLQDFRDGSRRFPAAAFPDHKRDLEKMGISHITIGYKISGGDAVVQLLGREPSRVPEQIVRCNLED